MEFDCHFTHFLRKLLELHPCCIFGRRPLFRFFPFLFLCELASFAPREPGGTPLWRWELVFGAFDWAPNPGFGDTRAAALAPNPGFVHTGAAASCAIVVRMWTRSIGEELGSWATRVEILLILVGTLNGEKLVTNLSGAQVGTQFDCFVKPACIPSPPVFGA